MFKVTEEMKAEIKDRLARTKSNASHVLIFTGDCAGYLDFDFEFTRNYTEAQEARASFTGLDSSNSAIISVYTL